MQLNPILKREVMVQSRSFTLPLMVSGVNLVLFLAALLGTFGILTRMRLSAEAMYGSFLLIYALVVGIGFLLLLFVTPSLTAGAISSERAAQTLDLLLMTQLSPARIIAGKLLAAVWELCMLLCSGIPAMCLPLLYGGVGAGDVLLMLLVFAAEAAVLLCIGLYASSLSVHTVRVTAAAYGITAGICIGLPALCLLISPFCQSGNNYSAYLLLLDPLMNVLCLLTSQTGYVGLFSELFYGLSLEPDPAFLRFFVPLSLAVQLTAGFFLLLLTVVNITPRYTVRRSARW